MVLLNFFKDKVFFDYKVVCYHPNNSLILKKILKKHQYVLEWTFRFRKWPQFYTPERVSDQGVSKSSGARKLTIFMKPAFHDLGLPNGIRKFEKIRRFQYVLEFPVDTLT